jgi:hypothetical protein
LRRGDKAVARVLGMCVLGHAADIGRDLAPGKSQPVVKPGL